LGLSLKTPTRLNTIEVAVDIDLQQYFGVIGRSTRRGRIDALKAQLAKIEFIDEGLDHSNRIGLGNIVVKKARQKDALSSVYPLNETLHLSVSTYAVTSVTTYTGTPACTSAIAVFTQPGPVAVLAAACSQSSVRAPIGSQSRAELGHEFALICSQND